MRSRKPPCRSSTPVMLLVLACLGCGDGGSNQFLSIGTGGTGGIYYPLGGAIASRMSLADAPRRYTAEVTGGSVENINRVLNGEMDLGFTMATNAYAAYYGDGETPPHPSLRLVAPLYPNLVHVVAARNGPVSEIGDFRGRRISVGSAGSGTEQVSRQVLEAYDLTYDDIEERFLSFRETADALRDGAIDAAIIAAGFPASAVLEVATAGVVTLLPIDEARQERLSADHPYYRSAVIPADAYPGMSREIPTIAVMNWMIGSDALDSAIVNRLLETLANDGPALVRVHAIAAQIDLTALGDPVPIPLHPAAEEWFRARR